MTDHTLVQAVHTMPARFERPSLGSFAMTIGILLFFLWSVQRTGVSLTEFIQGFPKWAA